MKAYHRVIVKKDKVYNDKVGSLYIDVLRDDVEYIDREVEVIDAPSYVDLQKGDKLIIHHNILRQKIDIKGNTIEGEYHIKDNLYNCPPEEIFLVKRVDSDEWEAVDPYVFVEPIPYDNKIQTSLIVTDDILKSEEDNYKGFNKERGILYYINKELKELGLEKGDEIVFSRDSEYEFTIEGKLLYKMSTRDILAKVEK